ncbi:WG repeat-containing protein [Brumimicrobium oceani]|uniref:WG repeat-containing protein n=1 Tax=Brumimicrobium oceani TaxID=2100725 RepID=A0A2U2XBC1_9FLAO|nr:WG repeat-containing protein [Brumimicrobium oceani]PWH85082.1 hypothetical protein DIT68_10615 [Brumimicrobium oceani]
MHKFIGSLFFIFVCIISFGQEIKYKGYIDWNSKNQFWGLIKFEEGKESDTVLRDVFEYIDIRKNSIVTIEHLNKKTQQVATNINIYDYDLNLLKKFSGKHEYYYHQIYIKKGNKTSVYDVDANNYILKDVVNIQKIDNVGFISNHKQEAILYDLDGNILVRTQGKGSFEFDKEYNWFVLKRNKKYDIYSQNGKPIAANVKKVTPIENNKEFNYNNPNNNLLISLTHANLTETILLNTVHQEKDGYGNLPYDNTTLSYRVLIKKFPGTFIKQTNHYDKLIVKKGEVMMLVDSSGNQIFKESFQKIYPQSSDTKDVYLVKNNDQYHFFSGNNNLVTNKDSIEYFDEVKVVNGNYNTYMYLMRQKDVEKYYLYNSSGKRLIENPIEDAFFGEENLFLIAKNNGMFAFSGFSDRFTSFKYTGYNTINYFDYALVEVLEGDKASLFVSDLDSVILAEYNFSRIKGIEGDSDMISKTVRAFKKGSNEFVLVSILFYNYENDIQLPFKIMENISFEDYIFDANLVEEYFYEYAPLLVKSNSKWGIINMNTWKMILNPEYDKLIYNDYKSLNKGSIVLKKEGKYGLFNMSGNLSIFSNKTVNKDSLGNEDRGVLEPIFEEIEFLDEEFMVTKKDGLYGICSLSSNTVWFNTILKDKPNNIYELIDLDDIINAPNAVVEGKEMQCYSQYGTVTCYDKIYAPEWGKEEQIRIAHKEDSLFVLNYSGGIIVKGIIENVKRHPNQDYWITKTNGKWGIRGYDLSEIIIEEKYDELISQNDDNVDFLMARINKKYGVIQGGKEVIPVEFDEVKFDEDYIFFRKEKLWGGKKVWGGKSIPAEQSSIDSVREILENQ